MSLKEKQQTEKRCASSLSFPSCKEQKGNCLEMCFRKEQTVLCDAKG